MFTRFSVDYRPLYFLASLGAGGMAVSFFMYLMFLVPHPHTRSRGWPTYGPPMRPTACWATPSSP